MPTEDRPRYEIKMVAEASQLPLVRSWLRTHPDAFRSAYPARQVNNIYFDTPGLRHFEDNIAGISKRKKVRLRWYGPDISKIPGSTLEIKYKQNMKGWKDTRRVTAVLDLEKSKWPQLMEAIRKELDGTVALLFGESTQPIILNHYRREYYISFDGQLRITLDTKQKCLPQWFHKNPNLAHPLPEQDQMVVELKAGAHNGSRAHTALLAIPLRVVRHSKYVTSAEQLLALLT